MRLRLGCPVRCADGRFGEVADVVVDPIGRRVTHLVVQPPRRHRLARLVPIALATGGDEAGVALSCKAEDVRSLDPVREFAYVRLAELPRGDPRWDIGIETMLAVPRDDTSGLADPVGEEDPHVSVSYDRVPRGEIEIRRQSVVTSADGHELGHVDGFLVDAGGAITHVMLRYGHLWDAREAIIPIGDVAAVGNDEVVLCLSRDAAGALPRRPLRRWPWTRASQPPCAEVDAPDEPSRPLAPPSDGA